MKHYYSFLLCAVLTIANPFEGNGQIKVMHDGTVNIGATTNPMARLQVTGNTLVSSCPSNFCTLSCAYIRGNNGHSTAAAPDYTWWYDDQTGLFHPTGGAIGFATVGTERMRLALNGNLGVGTSSPSNLYKIDVTGDARCTGSWITSDRQFKLGVEPISFALNRILLLQGVQYEFNANKFPSYGFTNKKTIGFIAQDVADIIPEAVQMDEFGHYAMNYDMIIPVLVEAIKEQQAQIAEMNERLKACCESEYDERMEKVNKISLLLFDKPILYQNSPNPFDESTVIGCHVPLDIKEAKIFVYTSGGELVRTIPVTGRGETHVVLHANELGAGMYLYALHTDGKISSALQMLLTKR